MSAKKLLNIQVFLNKQNAKESCKGKHKNFLRKLVDCPIHELMPKRGFKSRNYNVFNNGATFKSKQTVVICGCEIFKRHEEV
jgi:hypothetical protein